MPPEVREAKVAWLQTHTNSKCSTGSSDKDASYANKEEVEGNKYGDKDEEESQALLGSNMAQTIPSLPTKKSMIDLANEKSSDSDLDITSMFAFKTRPLKKTKK
eukprot:11944509-Ditylum_brightwellii.AAC.1